MMPELARIQDSRTPGRAAPGWGGGDALLGTVGWYWDASGGFIPGTPDTWNPQVAFLVFPRITSSPRIERRAMSRFAARSHHISTLPVADQVRELQTALSVNKSELARILRVSRPYRSSCSSSTVRSPTGSGGRSSTSSPGSTARSTSPSTMSSLGWRLRATP